MRTIAVSIDEHLLHYGVADATSTGHGGVLLEHDDNLIAGTAWALQGYTVAPLGVALDGFEDLLFTLVSRFQTADRTRFSLARYHETVTTDAVHEQIYAEIQRGLDAALLPLSAASIEQRISEICGVPLAIAGTFYLRIVRPGPRGDHNPPHRDVYLDHLRNAVNIYVPLAGSNEKSSLPLVPGSHLWPESDIERTAPGARVDGKTYRVPAVTGARAGLRMTRPDPAPGEVLVFSPYLIHGGAVNLNEDTTRVSLEMRFRRASV